MVAGKTPRLRCLVAAVASQASLALLLSGHAAAAAPPNPIQVENGRAGTAAWLVPHPDQTAIAGYADEPSYAPTTLDRRAEWPISRVTMATLERWESSRGQFRRSTAAAVMNPPIVIAAYPAHHTHTA